MRSKYIELGCLCKQGWSCRWTNSSYLHVREPDKTFNKARFLTVKLLLHRR